jgi:hypothetical protein
MREDTQLVIAQVNAAGRVYSQVFNECLEQKYSTAEAQTVATAAMKDFLVEIRKLLALPSA